MASKKETKIWQMCGKWDSNQNLGGETCDCYPVNDNFLKLPGEKNLNYYIQRCV